MNFAIGPLEDTTGFHEVDLSFPGIMAGPKVQFISVLVPLKQPSPFAVVFYSVNGQPSEYGLRLDMDRRAFLDQPAGIDDPGESLDEAANRIVEQVAPFAGQLLLQRLNEANATGKSRTEFILESAGRAAEDALLDQRMFHLDAERHEAFMAALDAPPRLEAVAKLRKLLAEPAPAAISFFSLPRRIRAAVHRQIDIGRGDRTLGKTAEDL